jgi:glycosyltransferase involved in cell wall biosynthesis
LKIVFVVWNTARCGGTRVVFELAAGLMRKGFTVSMVALTGNHDWFRTQIHVKYVAVPTIIGKVRNAFRFKQMNFDFVLLDEISKRLRIGFRPDLVRTLADNIPEVDATIATWYPTALAAWFGGKGRLYYLMQDFPQQAYDTGGAYGLKIFDASLRLPFHFIVNSNYTRDLVLRRQVNARITNGCVGIDHAILYPRNSANIGPTGKKVAMAIVRGGNIKGDEVMLKALNIVSKKTPIHVIVIGNEKFLQRAFRAVKPEFNYTQYSNIDDGTLARLYSSSDVFVFTSHVEGFGLPPLEAMACGVPVVTTDCKGNRDYAINGYNSLVVPPGDSVAVAKAVLRVLANVNLAEKLTKAGIETAKKYSWDNAVSQIEKALKEPNVEERIATEV